MHPLMAERPEFRASLLIPLLRQRDEWLERCVESAATQTVSCQVVVVMSPLTPDSNRAVVERLAARYPAIDIVVRPPGVRFAGALNLGISRLVCERFGLVLTDDWLEADAVESCLPIDAEIVSTRANVWDVDGETRLMDLDRMRHRFALAAIPTLERTAQYLGHFLFLSRAAVLAAGGVDETVGDSPGVDDYHLLWTMLERGARAAICERALYNIRDHEGERLTNRKPLDMLATMARILAKHGLVGNEHEQLLLWHARWFGQPLQRCITTAARRTKWVPIEHAGAVATELGLDSRVVACVREIEGSAPLDEHARSLAARGVVPESTAVAALVEAMNAGLLVAAAASPPSRVRTLAPPPTRSAVTPTTLAIIACGEPELVERALDEWRSHLRTHDRACRVLVADDSRHAADRAAIRRSTHAASGEHFGREQKDELACDLADRSGVPPELLRFALSDPMASDYTLGANLNAVVLATAGEAFLSVDQDVQCTTYRPSPIAGTTLVKGEVPAISRWYADDEEMRDRAAPCDIFGEHGAWLGRSIAARIVDTPAVIVGSWMGVLGSVGYADVTSELLSSASPELRADASRLQRVLAHPRALRCPERVTLNDGAGFTSAVMGLDNRTLLPPFLPIGRGIDLLNGLVTTTCRPGSMFAHLPWALRHERATAQRDAAGEPSPLWFVVAMLISRIAERMHTSSPADRMCELGAALVGVASLPNGAVKDAVGQIDRMRRTITAGRMRAELAATRDGCPEWRTGVEARIALLADVPRVPSPPRDLPPCIDDSPDAAWDRLRHVLRSYGQLLVAWPRIVAAAHARLRRAAA
jgi:hypothetical protein